MTIYIETDKDSQIKKVLIKHLLIF